MYKKVSTDMNFVEREKEVEKFWDDENIFQKSMDEKRGCGLYFSMTDLRQTMASRISDTF